MLARPTPLPLATVLLVATASVVAAAPDAEASVTYGTCGKMTIATLTTYQAQTTRISYYNQIRSDIEYRAPTAGAPLTYAEGTWSSANSTNSPTGLTALVYKRGLGKVLCTDTSPWYSSSS